MLERVPWWGRSLLGAACAVLGAVLTFRPFTSLSVLIALVAAGAFLMGLTSVAGRRHTEHRSTALATGVVWLAVGVLVLVWPDITTCSLAVVVGLALIVGGVLDVAAAVRGSIDERLAAAVGGVTSAIFGVLALSWPSVTVLVIAVVFGFRLVVFGFRLTWSSLRDRGRMHEPAATQPRGRVRRFAHLVGSVAGLAVALALAGLSATFNRGEPVVDAFYDTPASLPSEPGRLLRFEAFTRTIPANAEAWRVLYTTTRSDGVPAVASALVVVPADRSASALPVIALAHGTTGIDRSCAPSVLPGPFAAGAFYALDQVIDAGWALVATDYVGLGTEGGHPYMVGQAAGRSVLDSVRAARQLPAIELADDTVVWGHSQGGGAALWTGGLARTYAPEVGVIGVAALAPASDLVGLADTFTEVIGGSIFASFLLQGYADAYNDVAVADYVNPVARPSFDGVVGRCLAEPAALLSVIESLATGQQMFSTDLASGPLLDRLAENVPTLPIDAPLLLAQGDTDGLIVPAMQGAYVAARCADGQAIDYRTYPGLGHVPLVEADSPLIPDLFDWTRDRFDRADYVATCGE
ncbi:MAG TPA: lipase family protein [Ilumatobacter sp.]|nr:lipase family protein [Ilumatobacter sp.]